MNVVLNISIPSILQRFTLLFIFIAFFFIFGAISQAQTPHKYIKSLRIDIDSISNTWDLNTIVYQKKKHLYFHYQRDQSVMSITVEMSDPEIDVELRNTSDYEILENLSPIEGAIHNGKIKFKNLTNSENIQLKFALKAFSFKDEIQINIPLLQLHKTQIAAYPKSNELFQGEIKTIPLVTNDDGNILESPFWTNSGNADYRIVRENNIPKVQVRSKEPGPVSITIQAGLFHPYLDQKTKELNYKSPPILLDFIIKKTRLQYLSLSKSEVIFNFNKMHSSTEIEIDYNPNLKIKKTYRIEAQKKPGGNLVAELFTREIIDNGKILCWIRTYAYHNNKEGYLYVKDGDDAKFLTNLNIIPKTVINGISVQHQGKNWENSNKINPGETLHIKLTGQSLNKAKFSFPDLNQVTQDSTNSNVSEVIFQATVPKDINITTASILQKGQKTNKFLKVVENQRPRPLDFVSIVTKNKKFNLNKTSGQALVRHNIQDLKIVFDENRIDEKNQFYGKQYLNIDVEIRSERNQLIDKKSINNIAICPGPRSSRFNNYDRKDCFRKSNISLNNYLGKKIYQLFPWNTISVTVKHNQVKYKEAGVSTKLVSILEEKTSFDIDVSFPAGLVVKEAGKDGFGNLGGISLATIAQFSFYQPDKINKLRPYKIGAGFLAFNAFNFNSNSSERDVGAVVLASVYPLQRYERRKLSFPIYLGGGFFLSKETWFILFGPGIRVRL